VNRVSTEDETQDPQAEDLSDELARKYDPERLLKIVSKRAGRGEALDHAVRARYEKRFGVDLGHVRVYSGEFAEEFNRQRSAYAVTIGSTGMILMGGSPDKSMGSASGQALLAHELTHVAQQAQGFHKKGTVSGGMPFAEEHEVEAESVEHEVLHEEQHGAAAAQATNEAAAAKQAGQDMLKKTIEDIKHRVLDLLGDTARNQLWRNGSARRA
jgi:hypothetical protein